MIYDILNRVVYENRVADYLIVLGAIVGAFIIIRIIKFVVLRRVAAWAKKTEAPFDNVLVKNISKTLLPLLYLGAVYAAVSALTIPEGAATAVDTVAKILLTILGVRFIIAILVSAIEYYWLAKEANKARERTVRALMPIIKFCVWVIGVIFLLDNLGFKITTVVAGLGIGGVAVALAAQAILKDLFGYFSILFDRPFEIGDLIAVGDIKGRVKKVGVKTTRLTSLSGEQLIFSNADLTDSRVQNYRRMERRRVAFDLGITYETPTAKLKEIPAIVEKIISGVDGAVFDRAHFKSYGDFNLAFEIVYFVLGGDYGKYMDIQQEINLAIFEAFAKRKIDFAYPTQKVYLPKR
jgi:small-conductance mechanosensitive channel